jgi:hypothetical protein
MNCDDHAGPRGPTAGRRLTDYLELTARSGAGAVHGRRGCLSAAGLALDVVLLLHVLLGTARAAGVRAQPVAGFT